MKLYAYICDRLCKNLPSSHHKLKYFFCPACSYVYSIAIITLCIRSLYLISLLFSGQLLTLCNNGIDTMVPMECTKWMILGWDCTLNHSCVHLASRLTMDCLGVYAFVVKLPPTLFDKLFPPPTAYPTLTSCLPTTLATLAQKIGAYL